MQIQKSWDIWSHFEQLCSKELCKLLSERPSLRTETTSSPPEKNNFFWLFPLPAVSYITFSTLSENRVAPPSMNTSELKLLVYVKTSFACLSSDVLMQIIFKILNLFFVQTFKAYLSNVLISKDRSHCQSRLLEGNVLGHEIAVPSFTCTIPIVAAILKQLIKTLFKYMACCW